MSLSFVRPPENGIAISARDLQKTYDGKVPKTALHGMSLDIPAGSIFGLLGPNGAGKSTFINILAGTVIKTGGQEFSVIFLDPERLQDNVLTNINDIRGRVLGRDKPAGFVFTESDFLPRGSREGLTAGIPPGKRAMRVDATQVKGVYGLRRGDRFDIVATLPIDSSAFRGNQIGGTYGAQFDLMAKLNNLQKQATVKVVVQNGVVVATGDGLAEIAA